MSKHDKYVLFCYLSILDYVQVRYCAPLIKALTLESQPTGFAIYINSNSVFAGLEDPEHLRRPRQSALQTATQVYRPVHSGSQGQSAECQGHNKVNTKALKCQQFKSIFLSQEPEYSPESGGQQL